MRAAAAYNKPSNRLESSPISSPGSFILTAPRSLPLPLTAAKDTQPRGARAHGARVKVQAPNPNQTAAAGRPATHLPRKMASHPPSFLIDNPELEIELSHTKQKFVLISNRQFFAFLKLPDTSFRVSPRAARHLRSVRRASRKSPRTTAKCEPLIGNDMHSPTSATTLQCVTSIFLIGNEFRLAACIFRLSFFHPLALPFERFQALFSASRVSRLSVLLLRPLSGHGFNRAKREDRCDSSYRLPRALSRRARSIRAKRGSSLQGVGASAPTKERCQFFFLSRVPSARRVRLRAWIGFRLSIFEFRLFGFSR